MGDSLRINTTQNVLIDYEIAGIGERMVAALLDIIFVSVAYLIVSMIVNFAMASSSIMDGGEDAFSSMQAIMTLTFLPFMFYDLICETVMNGQSVGKKIMKIKVVRLDGRQATFGTLLVRWTFRIIDGVGSAFAIGTYSILLSKYSQRLGDIASGTTVVKINKQVFLHDTILYRINPNYQLVYSEIDQLSDSDIGTIKEVYEQCVRTRNYGALSKLAKTVKQKMGITSNMPDAQFIKAVLLDYSQFEFEKV